MACLGLCGFLWLTSAAQALNYYHSRVPVDGQSTSQRNKAAKAGLIEVLARVSGKTDIDQVIELNPAFANAASYIDQFQYELERNQWGESEEFLSMSFSPQVVENILKRAGQPFWPTNRPKALLWLVEDQPELGKQLINSEESDMLLSIMAAADRRGVPLMLPLLDLDDQLAISADQVWELDEQALLEASQRYAVDTILVGRYSQTSAGKWWGTWQFFHRGDSQFYELKQDDLNEFGALAIAPLANYLANLYAITPNAEGQSLYVMQIRGVENFADYRGVVSYLENLAAVTDLQIDFLQGNDLLVKLALDGDLDQFNNVISLDQKLQQMATQVSAQAPSIMYSQNDVSQPLRYLWVGQ